MDGWLGVDSACTGWKMLFDVVSGKHSTTGGIVGWHWREFKALQVAQFDCLARILSKVEEVGVRPEGLLNACIAEIPKVDGEAPLNWLLWASGLC